jgi:hypothetical protein
MADRRVDALRQGCLGNFKPAALRLSEEKSMGRDKVVWHVAHGWMYSYRCIAECVRVPGGRP